MSEYPGRGYGGDPYGREPYGYEEGYGRHSRYGHERHGHDRHGHSTCMVDNGEYGRHGRYGHSGSCIVDSGEYDRHRGRYGHSGGCIVDTSEYSPHSGHSSHSPHSGRIHHSSYSAEPSGYVSDLSPYGVGMGNAAFGVPPVVSPAYCVPYMAHFVIEQKVMTLSSGKFTIFNNEGRLLFQVESKFFGIHTKRILCDAKGVPLILLKKMNLTLHDRWEAYRGEDSHDSNLLFVMKKSSVYQMKPSFDIFLGANTALSKPDFTLKGDFYQYNYTIFFQHTPVAEASRTVNFQSVLAGKDQYGVTVYPGVDHAFIAALIVIVDQVQQDDTGTSK